MSDKKTHIPISKITAFIALFIIISASFMAQVVNFIRARFGHTVFMILLGIIAAVPVFIFLNFAVRRKYNFIKFILVAIALFAGLVFAMRMKIPVEKVHILEYGLLGWFAARDLLKTQNKILGILLACIFCAFVGALDEGFQAILPYRYFDLRDILFNGLGGAWGIILFILNRL